jgi:hypothetical protein
MVVIAIEIVDQSTSFAEHGTDRLFLTIIKTTSQRKRIDYC